MENKLNPIGLFDSGVGGISIWKEIIDLLPNESTIYLADSKNAPYGTKSTEEIIALSEKNTEFLLNRNCKLMVVACNTATTNAIAHLRAKYDVPFIGIEPAIKPAALFTQTKAIGILATKGTLSSELFAKTSEKFAGDVKIVEQVGTGLVEFIEGNRLNDLETFSLLESYLKPMLSENIDHLILGCTHFPFLIPQIQKIVPKNVKIIDSGEAVARQTKNILMQYALLNPSQTFPKHEIFSNLDITTLQTLLNGVTVQYKIKCLDF